MRLLIIDNYDSFTFNLMQLLAEAAGSIPEVVRNDAASWSEIDAIGFDGIVISPGPGRPDKRADFGISGDAIASARVPVLGICLGHQGLCAHYGAQVVRAPEGVHGRASEIHHAGGPLFAGVPSPFRAIRYHSLHVSHPIPRELDLLAWTADGLVMGAAHRTRPLWGLQFHPESISSEYGRCILDNFVKIVRERGPTRASRVPMRAPTIPSGTAPRETLRVAARRFEAKASPEDVFVASLASEINAFWLDSSSPRAECGRFSFLGCGRHSGSQIIQYDVHRRSIRVETEDGVSVEHGDLFDFLHERLDVAVSGGEDLPFAFRGGLVGYLGYELKRLTGSPYAHRASTPDAALIRCMRFLVYDHLLAHWWAVALHPVGREQKAIRWLAQTESEVQCTPRAAPVARGAWARTLPVRPLISKRNYLDRIHECQRQIANGESYEICLTNQFHGTLSVDPISAYRILRETNPAPYSAFLRFSGLAVLCSSPERFLRIDKDGWVESKPIKGTSPRHSDPGEDARLAQALQSSEKDRSENLMIVDLLRNDLGQVCEVGSIHVPKLHAIETFETVHQLVSTIRGRLRSGVTAVQCVRAVFPGGSMTGAPKLRTLDIIDQLEGTARGVYSGTIGYLSFCGSADLNIVIRTAVMDGDRVTIGAGGAIVGLSSPEAEAEEVSLKANSVLRALSLCSPVDEPMSAKFRE